MNLPNHFALDYNEYDTIIKVEIQGQDRAEIMDSLYFDLPDHKIWGLIPENNIQTLSRVLLLKKCSKEKDQTNSK